MGIEATQVGLRMRNVEGWSGHTLINMERQLMKFIFSIFHIF